MFYSNYCISDSGLDIIYTDYFEKKWKEYHNARLCEALAVIYSRVFFQRAVDFYAAGKKNLC